MNQYGETCPIWATRLKRVSLRRQNLADPTGGSGSLFWGTPRSTDHKGAGQVGDKAHTHRLQRHYLDAQALIVPYGPQPETMQAGGTKCDKVARDLNPRFVEWLMGFPIGWTALAPLETQSFQRWQQKHGDNYERRR